jgi:flagellar L-ring protein precursor FlgH
MKRSERRLLAVTVIVLACTGLSALPAGAADVPASSKSAGDAKNVKPSDNYDELFSRYLEAARATRQPGPDIGWMAGLAGDRRARNVNDLLTVQVVESISGSGTADSALTKDGKGSASVTNLFGLESKYPSWLDPGNIVNTASKTDFKGAGTTTRQGTLTATMTVRVAEVLPNGDLVLEGAREIEINGDRQMVVLSGVARVSDVTPANTVLSTQVGQLRIRYFGRGLMKDNLKPGWLIRVLNKIF